MQITQEWLAALYELGLRELAFDPVQGNIRAAFWHEGDCLDWLEMPCPGEEACEHLFLRVGDDGWLELV